MKLSQFRVWLGRGQVKTTNVIANLIKLPRRYLNGLPRFSFVIDKANFVSSPRERDDRYNY